MTRRHGHRQGLVVMASTGKATAAKAVQSQGVCASNVQMTGRLCVPRPITGRLCIQSQEGCAQKVEILTQMLPDQPKHEARKSMPAMPHGKYHIKIHAGHLKYTAAFLAMGG